MNASGYSKVVKATPIMQDEGTEHECAWVELETSDGTMIRWLRTGENENVVAAQLIMRGYTDDYCAMI